MFRAIATTALLAGMAYGQAAAGNTAPGPQAAPKAEDEQSSDLETGVHARDLLDDLSPLAPGKATLVGATVVSLDRVRDQITVRPFGGRDMKIIFDARTHVDRDGNPSSEHDLQKGDRVYIDTVLDGTQIYARNIRVRTQLPTGEGRGQVAEYDTATRTLVLTDALARTSARFRLSAEAAVKEGDKTIPASSLRVGQLVVVEFQPAAKSDTAVARHVTVLASPGASYVFNGRVSYLNLGSAMVVIIDPRDQKSYEVRLGPGVSATELREGQDVTAYTIFDGGQYTANSVVINPPPK